MQTHDDLIKKLLDEHGDLYRGFTRLILTLSTAAIGLLTTFRKTWIGETDSYVWIAQSALVLLLLSFFAGLAVQHAIMLRPRSLAEEVRRLADEAQRSDNSDPIGIRKAPQLHERISYKTQISTFYAAILLIVIYVILNTSGT